MLELHLVIQFNMFQEMRWWKKTESPFKNMAEKLKNPEIKNVAWIRWPNSKLLQKLTLTISEFGGIVGSHARCRKENLARGLIDHYPACLITTWCIAHTGGEEITSLRWSVVDSVQVDMDGPFYCFVFPHGRPIVVERCMLQCRSAKKNYVAQCCAWKEKGFPCFFFHFEAYW